VCVFATLLLAGFLVWHRSGADGQAASRARRDRVTRVWFAQSHAPSIAAGSPRRDSDALPRRSLSSVSATRTTPRSVQVMRCGRWRGAPELRRHPEDRGSAPGGAAPGATLCDTSPQCVKRVPPSFPLPVPPGDGHGLPTGSGIRRTCCARGQLVALHARTPVLLCLPWWCRFIQRSIKAQAGNHRNQCGERGARGTQGQRRIVTVRHGPDCPPGIPTPHDPKELSRPIRRLLCQRPPAAFACSAGARAVRKGKAHAARRAPGPIHGMGTRSIRQRESPSLRTAGIAAVRRQVEIAGRGIAAGVDRGHQRRAARRLRVAEAGAGVRATVWRARIRVAGAR